MAILRQSSTAPTSNKVRNALPHLERDGESRVKNRRDLNYDRTLQRSSLNEIPLVNADAHLKKLNETQATRVKVLPVGSASTPTL